MKSAAQTKKQPGKPKAKASRAASPVRRTAKVKAQVGPETTRTTPVQRTAGTPVPDLTAVGVDPQTAEAHVALCERCGPAHRHVMKNPRDTMALEHFGRNLSLCLARSQKKAPPA